MKDILRRFPKENYEVFKYVISHLNKWVSETASDSRADYTAGHPVQWPRGNITETRILTEQRFFLLWLNHDLC